jgi:hypothetical protein
LIRALKGQRMTTENGEYTEAIKDVRALLIESISRIKSQNQSNGYQIGRGRKVREPWEHLQYAADKLANPKAGALDALMGIQCLRHSGIEFRPIP